MAQTKLEVLQAEMARREEEVQAYQINIDNYAASVALMEADPDPDLVQFKKDLEERLALERVEQKKVNVLLKVIQTQVAALTA